MSLSRRGNPTSCSCPPFTPFIGSRFSLSLRYTPRQIALLPGDAQHLVVVEADHNEYNEAQGQVRGALTAAVLSSRTTPSIRVALGFLCLDWAVFMPNLATLRRGASREQSALRVSYPSERCSRMQRFCHGLISTAVTFLLCLFVPFLCPIR